MMSHKSVARKGTFQHQPPAQQPAQQPAQPKALEEDKKNSSEVKKTSVAAISTALRKFSNKGVANNKSSLTDEFGFSVKQLREMMEARGTEAVEVIEKAGGVEVVCQKLRTSPSIGIQNDPTDVKLRQTTFGKNEIPPKDSKSFCALVFEAAQDVVLIMLLISAVISVILWAVESFALTDETNNAGEESDTHGYIDSAAILGCVVIVVLISAFNDWSKEKQFRGLQKRVEGEHVFAVIRDGTDVQINVFEIVVGDICKVKYGDLIPADGILIQASDLCVDESSLTGESDLVKKSATSDPMVLAGTHVMEGSGTIVVTAVGVNSQSGIILTLLGAAGKDKTEDKDIGEKKGSELERIKRRSEVNTRIVEAIESKSKPDLEKGKNESSEDHSKSVLQTKLSILAIRIGYFGMVAAAITFFVTVLIFSVTTYGTKKQPFQTAHLNKFINFFITAITILVVAVPEGLPLAVTLSLAYSVKKMLNDNNLVRHLSACETMGNATVICSDKTGTLTTNRMTVVQAFVNGKLWKTLPKATDFQPPDMSDILVQAIALNSASTSRIEFPEGKGQLPTQIGNKTECALLQFVGDIGKNYEQVRKEFPESNYTRVYTFNSARKSMSTVVPLPGGGWRMFTKGASEMVMSMCDGIYWEGGKISSLTADLQKKILDEAITPMADEALRTISIAYRDFSGGEPNWNDEGSIISKMTCLCIVGIEDPVRPEVPDAILKCQRAGVVVRMVTGDNKNTAKSIALKCGILRPGGGGVVLEGKEFNQKIRGPDGEVSQDLLDKVWPTLRVLARSSPTDKYILVKGIIDSQVSSNREVVAVTGDGTNDGPALKKADVGFAMGLTGTDVAKEASDIILTDDNFTSIVKAVMWGRNVYDSIAKFLQFQLTVNVVAVAVAMIGACTVNTSPLKAVQMLWVNLIMDTLASLALATELPTADLLLRKPYGRTASLISPIMLRNIVTHSIFQLIITLVILFAGPQIFDIDNGVYVAEPSTHLTLVFNTFVIMTLFNEINARKIHGERNVFKGILKNPIYYIIWIGTFAGQVLIISFGGRVLFTYPLSLDEWMWCIAFGVSTLVVHQISNSIPSSWVAGCLGAFKGMRAKKKRKARSSKF